MKRIIIMLLIVSSAVTSANAQQRNQSKAQPKPERVINKLNLIANHYGKRKGQIFSVNKNPNTGLIESSERVVHFTIDPFDEDADPAMAVLPQDFMHDEPLSYQILHIMPGSTQKFSLNAVASTTNSKYYHIRTKNSEEMWFMACKNPDNPQLRDAYAIVWEDEDDEQGYTSGTVYMITSLRPDIYEKEMETSKKVFKIEGRVDANIKDSLYNIYIADSRDALDAVGDDDYVTCVPVVNKRFEYQTELVRPMAGRLRCIFPDGQLCSTWIDLNFVPGKTYYITVHDGSYDVSEFDDPLVEEPDSLPQSSALWEPSPQVRLQFEAKAAAIQANTKAIKSTYATLETWMKIGSLTGTDNYFAQIIRLNKELDVKIQDMIKLLKTMEVPASQESERAMAIGSIYREQLKFFTEQNQGFTEMYKQVGVLTKAAQKTQKYVNKLTEKYMAEMSKMMDIYTNELIK